MTLLLLRGGTRLPCPHLCRVVLVSPSCSDTTVRSHIIQNKLVSAGSLDIPPGETDVRHDGYFTLKRPAKLLVF